MRPDRGPLRQIHSALFDLARSRDEVTGWRSSAVEEAIAPELLSVLDQLGYAVAVADESGKCVYASPRWCTMLGYRPDETAKLEHLDRMIAPDAREPVRRSSVDPGVDAPTDGDEVELIRADDSRVSVELARRMIATDEGGLTLLVARDVSADRARDRRILRYEESCKRMPSGFMIWERSRDEEQAFSLQVANPAAREHLDVLLSTGPEDGEPGLDLDALVRLEPGQTVDLGEWTAPGPGAGRHLHVRAYGLDDDASAVIVEDLTSLQAASDERRDLLERLISVGDEERRAIADGLHDDTLQRLAASALLVESVARHPETEDGALRLQEVEREIRHTIHSLRNLIFELTPPQVDDDGIAAAIDRVAAHLFADVPATYQADIDLPDDLDHHLISMTYRIAAEALTNARRHAGAERVTISLRVERGQVVGRVSDDGFGPSEIAEHPGHLGIRSMRERTEAFGGVFEIGENDTGGTDVSWSIPVRREIAERAPVRLYREWRPPDRRRPPPDRRPEDFKSLVDATPDIISCFDRSLRHTYVNPAAGTVSGLEASDFLGRSNRDLGMPDELADQWDDVILEVFRSGEIMRTAFVYDTPDGPRTFDARVVPERLRADGPVARVWGMVRDVTQYVERGPDG